MAALQPQSPPHRAQPQDRKLTLTPIQAEHIIRAHLPGHTHSTVRILTEINNKDTGYSYTSSTRTYIADIWTSPSRPNPTPCSCFITIGLPAPVSSESSNTPSSTYHTNSLLTTHNLISLIIKHTSIPLPQPILLTSLAFPSVNSASSTEPFPYHVLLSPAAPIASTSILPLREARERGLLGEKELARIEMQIGAFLGQMHSGVLGEWFGLPRPEAQASGGAGSGEEKQGYKVLPLGMDGPNPKYPSESYSWQETFTHLLESLLSEFESGAAGTGVNLDLDLPYEDIRRYLSRAIAYFLFDDVEVPSLVWMTGSEDDVYVFVLSPVDASTNAASKTPSAAPGTASGIAAILPNIAHALWGDPLLESFFSSSPSLSSLSSSSSVPPSTSSSASSTPPLPTPAPNRTPGPSQALLEAYLASGGRPPILFPRHKTKRLWYDLFLGLVVLRERGISDGTSKDLGDIDREWALGLVSSSVEGLREAPCY